MASYVTVPDRTVYPDNNWSKIDEKMEYFKEYANTQTTNLEEYIDDLKAVLSTFDPDSDTVDVPIPSLDGPSFPEVPTWGDITLDTNWPISPTDPILKEYGNLDFTYTAPTMPSDISGSFDWNIEAYSSEMWADLFAKVHDDIVNGGTGLTDDVHSIIVARELETRRINQDREYQTALDETGATGFNLPSGHTAAVIAEFQREVLKRDQDALNAITEKDFELAQQNTQFAVTTGKELEGLLRQTYEFAQNISFEAAKAVKDYLIAVYNANVQAYLAAWEGIKTELEALKTKIEAIAEYNNGLISVYESKANVYETKIKAISEKNQALLDERKIEVETYAVEVGAVETQYNALVAEMEAQLKAAELEISQAIENLKIDLEAYTSKATLSERVSEAIANIGAQVVASALAGINTTLTNTYGGTEHVGETWSHGETLGESHDYSEE